MSIPEEMERSLRAAYADPPRAYHSFAHVEAVLAHVRAVPHWVRPREVFLAALFHDAIYVVGRSDNEVRSADFALTACRTWLSGEPIDLALLRRLIELTAKHGKLQPADLDDDARHFLDCDMAILGAAPAEFDAYDAAIADEYRSVPAPLYQLNRRRFLSGLLEKERIFLSDHFHARLDAPARANLRRALLP